MSLDFLCLIVSVGGLVLDRTVVHFHGIAAFQPVINGRLIVNSELIYSLAVAKNVTQTKTGTSCLDIVLDSVVIHPCSTNTDRHGHISLEDDGHEERHISLYEVERIGPWQSLRCSQRLKCLVFHVW